MTIYAALKADHRKVQSLLEELVELGTGDEKRRSPLIESIRSELIPHARAEEAVFYNSIRAVATGKRIIAHGYQEHVEAETLLRALQVADFMDLGWKATAKKLKQTLEHHISEEEGEIFSAAKKLFSEQEAEVIGQTFEAMKPKIKTESMVETTLDMVINMMPPRISEALRISRTP